MKQLYLYTTSGCHLCEMAEEILVTLAAEGVIQWLPVEISDSDELVDRYGVHIPVVRSEQHDQEIGWPFSRQKLKQWAAGM
ncbi:MAG: glutaredoxin family protein [Endozoicomonas sp.]